MKWNNKEMEFLVDNHKEMTINAIAEKLNRTYRSVEKKMSRLKLYSQKWRDYEIDYLLGAYGNISPYKIANVLNRSYSSIIQKANALGFKSNCKFHALKHNGDFFELWSNELAYLVGIVLSDGSISNDGCNGYFVRISMCDFDVLDKLKYNSCNKVNIRKSKLPSNNHIFTLDFRGKEVRDFFINIGIGPNKTHVVGFPKLIPPNYVPDVIRGIFDGDGSVIIDEHRNGYPKTNICGTEGLLNAIKSYVGIRCNMYKKRNTTYGIYYNGINAVEFMDYIYKKSTSATRMDRKYTRYLKALEWKSGRFT